MKKKMEDDVVVDGEEKRRRNNDGFFFLIKELPSDVFHQNLNSPLIFGQLIDLSKIGQDSPSLLSLAFMVHTTMTASPHDSTINK